MKITFAFFCFIIVFMSCKSKKQAIEFDYPGLGLIIEAYYRDYFNYPNTMNDLTSFINKYNFPDNYAKTIKELNVNIDEMQLIKDSDELRLILKDNVLCKIALRSPCDELSFNTAFYLNRILFFDKNGFLLTSNNLGEVFKNDLKIIKYKFDKVKTYNETNEYVILNYQYSKGLMLYCDMNLILSDYDYFNQLELYLDTFCIKYGVDRIIFTTPIFF